MATIEFTERLPAYRTPQWPACSALPAADVTPSPYFRWKRSVDFLLAAMLLAPALPIIAVLVLLVRTTSRGPGVYRQTRVGKNGRIFTMYKIRSMCSDAEAKTGAMWARTGDPRVTPLGRILRTLHLDELPQLFNVLSGDMSLVGPRPERPEFVDMLADKIPGYLHRLAAPPGITGLAQVNLPPDTDLDSVRRKLDLDLEYIRSGGLSLDLRLLACTALRVLKIYEPLVLGLFALRREVPDCVCNPPAADVGLPTAATHAAPRCAAHETEQSAPPALQEPLPWSVAAGGFASMPKLR